MLQDMKKGTATFVMPHRRYENEKSKGYLDEAIKSIFSQTDQNFKLVIVDDMSPCEEVIDYFKQIKNKYFDKVHIIFNPTNKGAGNARNIAIRWAYENQSPMIIFNDHDDISHPKRLEVVRNEFVKDEDATVVYSTFVVIDENGRIVSLEELALDIREILDGHTKDIVRGKNSWIALGIEKNYTTLTSSTAVRTEVANKYLFPVVRTCEDSHTWYRYGAHPGNFVYTPDIPSLYRVPNKVNSTSRELFNDFYELMAKTDAEGFKEAMKIANENGSVNLSKMEKNELLIKFYIKLGETLKRAGQILLARQQIKIASEISLSKALEVFNSRKIDNDLWID